MSIRYLGSKLRVLEALASLIGESSTGLGESSTGSGKFVDGFSGTGVVASIAADLGWDVHVNDHLRCARLLSIARLVSASDISYRDIGGYVAAVEQLNSASPRPGFLWREYSPASGKHAPRPRLYFTEDNAARLDGMRFQIREWAEGRNLSDAEVALLLADLIEAASAVANTAGTFGCFLSDWSSTALRNVEVTVRELRTDPVRFTCGELDVFSVFTEEQDTLYLDPPYTKRNYAAYYHVLETIAHGDEPVVAGVTGLRPWESKASPFNYKRRALHAMLSLVRQSPARRVLISYSDDGHIDLKALAQGLGSSGTVQIHELGEIPRYQPRGAVAHGVGEYLLEFQRATL